MRAMTVALAACCGVLLSTPVAAHSVAEWSLGVQRRVACNLVYPFMPRVPAGDVVAIVRFLVDEDGRVGEPTITRSSGVAPFDRAVLLAVKMASPIPPHPTGRPRVMANLPVRFVPPDGPIVWPPSRRLCGPFYGR